MECDILVVGAGVLGLSSAYYLKKGNPGKSVVVVDRFGSPGQGNSAKSEGGYRNLFTSESNYLLADSTIDFMHHMEEEMGHDLKLSEMGYLFLFSEEQYARQRGALKRIEERGSETRVTGKEELKGMIPGLVTDFDGDEEAELLGLEPVDMGVFGAKCGGVDADALVRAYESEFLKAGGETRYGTEVEGLTLKPVEELEIPGEPFVWQDVHITGVKTSKGDIEAETTVVAAGVWSEKLLDPVGLDSYMRPKKRQIFAFKDPRLSSLLDVKGFNSYGVIPLTILPKSSILFRPEFSEGTFWLACADDLGRAFGLEDECFEDVRPVNMWAGQYAINSFDGLPVVTGEEGLIYVGAASGSGIMKCDAIGRIAAAKYAGEKEAELYGGRRFKVADLGISGRNVERETLII
jgi:glycine/D-amino acid oxidase-like deaminating enzyme